MAQPIHDAQSVQRSRLTEAVALVPGSIVSKPLLDTGGLKQILFAMDAGQEISAHRAPFVATIHILDGALRLNVSGELHELSAGDWLVMPPQAPHDLHADVPVRFLLTLVKGTAPVAP